MRGRRPFVVALLLVVCTACRGNETAVSTTTQPVVHASAEARAQTIHMEIPVAPGMPDLPRLLARDGLRAMGYTVETAAYGDNAIAIQSMLRGNLDFARIPMPQALAAIQQGADITIIMGGGGQSRILATVPAITTCSGLNNKQVSVPNLVSAQTMTLRRYIATGCPGTEVELVVIAGVENRLAALLSNRTAAAILESTNLTALQREHGSKFNVLADFSVDFPELNGAMVVAPRAFVQKYPATARDIVREMVLAIRRMQEPAVLRRAIDTYLELTADEADSIGKLYLERKMWDVNGGISDDMLKANIDFVVESGMLKPGLTPAQVADRSYLSAVLNDIGRK